MFQKSIKDLHVYLSRHKSFDCAAGQAQFRDVVTFANTHDTAAFALSLMI